jgi:hypothetical protein
VENKKVTSSSQVSKGLSVRTKNDSDSPHTANKSVEESIDVVNTSSSKDQSRIPIFLCYELNRVEYNDGTGTESVR